MRSPRYSMMRAPFLIGRIAYTPRPWMPESRVSTAGRDPAASTSLRRRCGRRGALFEDERDAPRSCLRLGFLAMEGSNGDRRLDARMRLVIQELEVFELVLEDRRRLAFDREPRRRQRRALQLFVGLVEMIEIQVAVAAGPDEVAGGELALLSEHVREQRIGRDVERHAEEHVGA